MRVQLGDVRGQTDTLLEPGNLYAEVGRLEDAASLYRTAADHSIISSDTMLAGRCWNNLGNTSYLCRRWDQARQAIHRAIECKEPLGHAAEPWKTWTILGDIEAGASSADLAVQAKARARACMLPT